MYVETALILALLTFFFYGNQQNILTHHINIFEKTKFSSLRKKSEYCFKINLLQ